MGLFGPCLRGVLRTHGPGNSYFETALRTWSQQGLLASVLQAASKPSLAAQRLLCGILRHTYIIGLRTPVYIAAAITSTSTTTAKRLPKLSNLTL